MLFLISDQCSQVFKLNVKFFFYFIRCVERSCKSIAHRSGLHTKNVGSAHQIFQGFKQFPLVIVVVFRSSSSTRHVLWSEGTRHFPQLFGLTLGGVPAKTSGHRREGDHVHPVDCWIACLMTGWMVFGVVMLHPTHVQPHCLGKHEMISVVPQPCSGFSILSRSEKGPHIIVSNDALGC